MCEYKLMGRCFNPGRSKAGVLAVECQGCANCDLTTEAEMEEE